MYNETEQYERMVKYLSLSLRDIKMYIKLPDSELYQRDVRLSRDELKKCKLKILSYMKYKKLGDIAKVYEIFLNNEESISPYLKICDEIIHQYKKQA